VTAEEAAVVGELLRLAAEQLELDGPPPGPDEPLAGRLDSLQLLTLAVAIEDRFHVILTDDEAAEATTLLAMARLVLVRADPVRLPTGQPPEAA
jgi:acyl carrier protein